MVETFGHSTFKPIFQNLINVLKVVEYKKTLGTSVINIVSRYILLHLFIFLFRVMNAYFHVNIVGRDSRESMTWRSTPGLTQERSRTSAAFVARSLYTIQVRHTDLPFANLNVYYCHWSIKMYSCLPLVIKSFSLSFINIVTCLT